MKKIAFGLSMLVVMILGCAVFAENAQRNGDTLTITPNINEENINDINNIGLRFCNDGLESQKLTKLLKIQLQPGQRQEICTIFYNKYADKSIKVTMGFTKGSKNADGTVNCDENTSDNVFAHLIQSNDKDLTFTLSGNEQLVKKFKLNLPTTATGYMYGCISYSLPDNFSKSTGDIFGILVRKVAPIEITITGNVYSFGRRDDIKDVYATNKAGLLKAIIAILALWLVVTIFKTSKKTKKSHTKR